MHTRVPLIISGSFFCLFCCRVNLHRINDALIVFFFFFLYVIPFALLFACVRIRAESSLCK